MENKLFKIGYAKSRERESMFDKMKSFMDMQRKVQEIKRELENTDFEISSSDGLVKITMNGAQEVKAVVFQGEPKEIDKAELEKAVKDAYNRAIKRSHEIAALKMKDVTGLNLPGML
jgi:DNA-binding YbaB/EbfC family protein